MKKIITSKTKYNLFIHNTIKPSKNIEFFAYVDTEPNCNNKVKVSKIYVKPALCENCGCLISPIAKNISNNFGYTVGTTCPNCGSCCSNYF